jgi:hypothetical protein
MRRTRGLLIAVVMVLLAGEARAQRCLGGHPYRISHFRLGVGIDKDKFAESYGVDVRYSTAGVFGVVDAAIKTWEPDTFNDESQLLGVSVGIAFPRDGEARLSLCPMLSFRTTSGPDQAAGIAWHYSERSFAGSLSLGYLLNPTSGWEIVPTASLLVGTTNPTMKTQAGTSLASYKSFCCGRRTFGTISLGFGLGLGRTMSILPTISIPLDAAGETIYGAHLVIGLGRELDL